MLIPFHYWQVVLMSRFVCAMLHMEACISTCNNNFYLILSFCRFCPHEYYPFDENDIDKYVVGDDYLPTWKVPDLGDYYNKLGFGMKDSLNAYLKSKGKDPETIWDQINHAIRIVCLAKEQKIADILKRYVHRFYKNM